MVKLAWKNLMDYYNQLRRRYDRAVAAGLEPPDSKWQFFDMLHFTRQNKLPVKRKYNYIEPSKVGCICTNLLSDLFKTIFTKYFFFTLFLLCFFINSLNLKIPRSDEQFVEKSPNAAPVSFYFFFIVLKFY